MVAHQGFLVKPLEKSDLNDGGGGGENIQRWNLSMPSVPAAV